MFGLFKKKLPHCDTLFKKFLSPWYAKENRPQMTRPDMYQIAAYDGNPIDLDKIQYLQGNNLIDSKRLINETMVEALMEDYQNIVSFDKLDLNVLNAVDKYFDNKKILDLINESDPNDFSNPYLVMVCEFGTLLGHLFMQKEGFDWLYSKPYFHSIIVHKETGFGITVFDWAVKKFSSYGVDDGFVAKFQAALNGIQEYQKNPNNK